MVLLATYSAYFFSSGGVAAWTTHNCGAHAYVGCCSAGQGRAGQGSAVAGCELEEGKKDRNGRKQGFFFSPLLFFLFFFPVVYVLELKREGGVGCREEEEEEEENNGSPPPPPPQQRQT